MSPTLVRLFPRCAVVVALVAACGLAACGRNGPLEAPPSAQAAPPPTVKDGKPAAEAGQPVAVAPKKHFFLDFLLD